MEFKYSISILFSNIGYVFKLIAWILLSMLVTAAIGAGMIIPIWRVLSATTDVNAHVIALKECFSQVWEGSINMRTAAHDIVPEVIEALNSMNNNPSALAGLIIAICFLFALYCFIRGLSLYSLSDIINKLMSQNTRFGFAGNMVFNLKKNIRFSACRLIISFPIDVAFAAIMISMAIVFYQLIGLITVPIMLVFSVVFYSLRAILFSGWLPRLLYHPDERMLVAFKRSIYYVKYNFTDLFKAYAIIFTMIYLIIYLCTIPTGGLTAIVIIPTHFFLLRTVELIRYYRSKGLSFYLDGSTVVNTVDYGFRPDNQEAASSADNKNIIHEESAENNDKEDKNEQE